MRRICPSFAAVIAAVLALGGCSLFDFDLSRQVPRQTIQGDPAAAAAGQLLGNSGLLPNPFMLNIDVRAEQQAHDTGPIDAVRMKSFQLALDPSSPTRNFDFLDEAHIFVQSTRQGSTLQRLEIATLAPVPRGRSTLDFAVNGSLNLLPYINEGVAITAEARARVPAQDVIFAGTIVLRVSPL